MSVWDGGLFQHVTRDGERRTNSLAGELAKVHEMAAYMSAETGGPVTPVLCLAGTQEAGFGPPTAVHDVWVVPVSALVGWLESRPVVLNREDAARAVTRAITDFPSTTTHPELLAAMGMAELDKRSAVTSNGHGRRPSDRGRARPRDRPIRPTARAGARAVGIDAVAQASASHPRRAAPYACCDHRRAQCSDLAGSGSSRRHGRVVVTFAIACLRTGADAGDHPKPARAPVASSRLATDCLRVTSAEVAAVVGRRLQPVSASGECDWGTRLDDPTTVLVTVRMTPPHAAFETELVTSAAQHRVVYGVALDRRFQPATSLLVAAGQPIRGGARPLTALADTKIIVARTRLGVSDDRARAMAQLIARASVSPG